MPSASRLLHAAKVFAAWKQRGLCASCGEPLRPGFHGDHIWARRNGGPDVPANVQALCQRCNLSKGAR